MLFGFDDLSSLAFCFAASHHYLGCAAVPGWDSVRHDELALSQSVRRFVKI